MAALPYIQLAFTVAQAAQQDAAGRFNQDIQNRNAQIAEQEKALIGQKNVYDTQQFRKQFNQLQGKTKTRILTSGTTLSGSGLRVLHNNEVEAKLQENIMEFNSQVAQNAKQSEADLSRMAGQFARQQGRSAAMGTLFQGLGSFAQSAPGKSLLDSIPNPFSSPTTLST